MLRLNVLKEIPTNSIDCVICDLPYGTTYASFDTVLKNNKSVKSYNIIDLSLLWNEYKRLIKEDGAIILFASQPFTTTLISSNIEWFKYSWIWKKNKASNHVAVRYQPLKVTEDILIFSNAGCNTNCRIPIKYNPQGVLWKKETKTRKNSIKKDGVYRYNSLKEGNYEIQGTNYPTNILEYSIPSGKDRCHPTQKPVDLLEYLILTYSNEGDTILDNCMGSGSTGVACMNTGRKFIGIEKEEKFFKIAEERIKEASNNLNQFME